MDTKIITNKVPQVNLAPGVLDSFEPLTLPNFLSDLKTLIKKYDK